MYFIFSNMNFYNEIIVHSYTGGFFLFKFACGFLTFWYILEQTKYNYFFDNCTIAISPCTCIDF